jgi:type VI secretion system protein ImpL
MARGAHAREGAVAPYLEYLVWRVDTLTAREARHPRSDTPGQDGPVQALATAFGGRLPYVAAFFPDMYRSYAIWETDLGLLQRERGEMQLWANRIVETEGRDLHWLVEWANTRPNLAGVTLDDFWGGSGRVLHATRVSGAFTIQGKAEISRLMDQLSLVAVDQEAFGRHREAFWEWYAKEFFEQWTRFARHFGLGTGKLLAREDWLNASATMATLDNPYFNLIARMEEEFAAVRRIKVHSDINRLSQEFVYITNSYKAKKGKATLKATIAEKMQRLEARLEKLDNSLAAAEEFTEYMQQLDAFVPVTTTTRAAYRFALQNYGQDSADGQSSPVVLALSAMNNMRSLLGKDRAAEESFWHLMAGPLEFLITLTTYETACGVNDLWQAQVVAETASTPEHELWSALFGDQGVVPAFASGAAKPFLRRTRDGWFPGSWMGIHFPFRQEFLSFLEQGAVRRQQLQPKYTVSISAVPTDVNDEAKSEPYQTTLTLQCAGRQQSLDNYNAPNALDFVWEPATCDDVTLTIYFEETTLTQTWKGQWGFQAFLRMFRDGRKVYVPNDFPQQKETLKRLGVQRIQVNYILKNAEPVLSIEQYPALKVPDRAAQCWSGLGAGPMEEETWRQSPDDSLGTAKPSAGTGKASPRDHQNSAPTSPTQGVTP